MLLWQKHKRLSLRSVVHLNTFPNKVIIFGKFKLSIWVARVFAGPTHTVCITISDGQEMQHIGWFSSVQALMASVSVCLKLCYYLFQMCGQFVSIPRLPTVSVYLQVNWLRPEFHLLRLDVDLLKNLLSATYRGIAKLIVRLVVQQIRKKMEAVERGPRHTLHVCLAPWSLLFSWVYTVDWFIQ